ncbi:MAG: VWA domain-containing protein [Bradymonadaceae bacterium]|nr:VWA domain-containing protein [Lujinxingiaceae bacterium]
MSLTSAALFGVAGCDTVALISFSERQFLDIYPVGAAAPGGQCEGVGNELKLRFVMMADDLTPITNRPGEVVDNVQVNFGADSVRVSNSGRVFSMPDELCATNSDCPSGFTCDVASTNLSPTLKRCFKASDVGLRGTPRFVSDTTKNQLFGVLYENSGSLRGWMPTDVGSLTPVNDDGTSTGSADSGPNAARATDNDSARKAALIGLTSFWQIARDNAERENSRRTLYGLWTFAGSSAQVISHIPNDDSLWASRPETVVQARERLADSVNNPSATRANVFEAMTLVLEQGFADASFADYDKTLVVFVDGPDDLRLKQSHTADTVIDRAAALGVRLFLVHLDPKLNADSLRDDFVYYEQQDECSADSECKNFEQCRKPQRFAITPGSVTYPSNHGENPDAQYCMPKRDANGRIGAISEYARMACETEGGYIYVTSATSLRQRMENLPFTMDGMWELGLEVSQLERKSVPAGEAYRLQTEFSVDLGNENKSVNFSQLGTSGQGSDDSRDNRPAFFAAP